MRVKEERNLIRERIYYAVGLELFSPLCVAGGMDLNTDSDVMRNGRGECLIPGTSVAGAFRQYLDPGREEGGIFGYSKGEEGQMSEVFFSDVYFDEPAEVSRRDGVRLTEERRVETGKKFDWEIIEPGITATLYISYVRRENSPKGGEDKLIQAFLALDGGEIRFGAKKTSGFGRMKIREIRRRAFINEKEADPCRDKACKEGEERIQSADASLYVPCSQNARDHAEARTLADEWLEFMENPRDRKHYVLWEDWRTKESKKSETCIVRIPLRLTGGISIRRYSTRSGEADYEHLTSRRRADQGAGSPVVSCAIVPGSSLRGAIRADARRILRELHCEDAEDCIGYWFGYTDARARSLITVEECVFEEEPGSPMCDLPITRNRISRFDASVLDGALYSEIAHFGGKICLEMRIQKKEGYRRILKLLWLVAQDIQMGYLPIGGETAIGRGIFEAAGKPEGFDEIEGERRQAADEDFREWLSKRKNETEGKGGDLDGDTN